MKLRHNLLALALMSVFAPAALMSCGGGGGGSGNGSGAGAVVSPLGVEFLSAPEVTDIVQRAVQASLDRGQVSTIAVVDRVGNVLAIYRMTGAAANALISSGLNTATPGPGPGLENTPVPAEAAAIAKAVTGAYLSSSGNAFSTRTASQIVQEFFQPGETGQPSGPLYGVQFSQLPCSDLNVWESQHPSIGPKRSPLGLSADPGGFPIYQNGRVVGGIGVIATPAGLAVNGTYSLDRNLQVNEQDFDEEIALAALPASLRAPIDIRANRITANGQSFQYSNSEPAVAGTANLAASGSFVGFAGYKSGVAVTPGATYGSADSGIVPTTNPAFAGLSAYNLTVNGGATRYPVSAGTALTATEVQNVLAEAIKVANRARAQIRRPVGSPVEVTVSVIDTTGAMLGQIRTSDAPIFGTDVSLQKARSALAFSSSTALTDFLNSGNAANDALVNAMNSFFAEQPAVLDGTVAFSARAIGTVHRPYFPDGDTSMPRGPLSTAISEANNNWSPFNLGFQLNIVANQVFGTLTSNARPANDFNPLAATTCADPAVSVANQQRFANGLQIFPGGFPIYKGDALVGAIGVSGDGVDQDDMVGYLGVINGAVAAGTLNLRPFPATLRRADSLSKGGQNLKYIQCPQTPFNDSTATNVCP